MGSLFSQRQGQENPEHDDIEDHVIEAAQPHSPASPRQTRILLAFNAPNRLSSLATAHPEIFDLVSESLISRGALRSLASLNSASRTLYEATLPLLWRTFIWDPYGKGRKKTKAYWNLLSTCRGAEYIRFFVDRGKRPSSSHKKLPGLVSHLIASTGDQLKAYIAEFNDDGETKFVDSDERKVICHLLPAYEPMSAGDEDLITLRHALVHLAPPSGRPDNRRLSKKKPVTANRQPSTNPTSIGYAFFIIHPCRPDKQYRPFPSSIDHYTTGNPLPVLPVTLDAVLLAPSSSAFTQDDKPRLARIVFDFLASMDQEPCQGGVEWNGFVGQFSTRRIQEEEKCRSYVEFHGQKGEESVLVCAQATAQALNPFRKSKTFNWIELQLDNDAARFPHDNTILHRILGTLLPHYLVHAPRRLCPPSHGMGDVVIEDESDDLLAGLKRVVPAAGVVSHEQEERDVVEYYIKRYPEGTGAEEDETWRDSHDEHVVYYKEFAV